ncbi:MAG: (Fe-S)-binding protein [Desulfobacteraceae bacterium 4572_89]|nr:MAG: (Fe-S)-binding protein [Desulfobacteraceae bacterium 4572_89]
MEKLARDVKALEDQLAICTRCGMCQANCPIYAKTRQESDVSRGKLALIKGLIDQVFDDAKGVNQRINRCLLCGSCSYKCPSNVDTVQIILKARSIINQYLGLSLAKKIIFKNLLANPRTFNRLMEAAAPFQKLAFKQEKNSQGTSCARIASPLLRHRHMVPLSNTPFSSQINEMDFREKGKGLRVAFFTGCLIDKVFPNIAHSVMDVLTHFKARVFIPENQGCCGIPALASGDMKTFKKLLAFHVNLFSARDFDYLVTACATCSSTIINLWPTLLQGQGINDPGIGKLLEKAAVIAEKTVDISWLMAKRFDISSPFKEKPYPQETGLKETDTKEISPKEISPQETITYHDPCHLKKSLGVFEEPRQVIKACGKNLVEMAAPDQCCGMGGSFNLDHYDLSALIGEDKALDIMDTGCSTVATSCPACIMQISDMLARQNSRIRVKHPVEIYGEQLKNRE